VDDKLVDDKRLERLESSWQGRHMRMIDEVNNLRGRLEKLEHDVTELMELVKTIGEQS